MAIPAAPTEPEHMDVLQNIEFAIVTVFKELPQMVDFDVKKALDALERYYLALSRGNVPPPIELDGPAEQVSAAVQPVCEWRIGNATEAGGLPPLPDEQALTHAEIVRSLRRINRSVDKWTKRGGQQGYLLFVRQYVV